MSKTPAIKSPSSDERGSTLAIFAVMLTGLLGAAAIAVDVGMGFNARSEAQRVADAAALAGASAFKTMEGSIGEAAASDRAFDYALSNDVNGSLVDSSEVVVTPTYSDISGIVKEVEVTITRQDIPAWFARVLGILDIDVQARAVAKVSEGGVVNQCLLPFTPPDIWHDEDGDTDGDHLPDPGEEWEYDPTQGDNYERWAGPGSTAGTGYGSGHRGGDIGRELYIKAGPPGQGGGPGALDEPFSPGNFYSWNMPQQSNGCAVSHGGGLPDVSYDILNCNTCDIDLDTEYLLETGNMVPLIDDFQTIIGQDSGAYWDTGCDCVANSSFGDFRDSPRVRPIAFFDPTFDLSGGSAPVEFNNFAWVFIQEALGAPDAVVTVRFMGYIDGGPGGPTSGPLVQYLRLIE